MSNWHAVRRQPCFQGLSRVFRAVVTGDDGIRLRMETKSLLSFPRKWLIKHTEKLKETELMEAGWNPEAGI